MTVARKKIYSLRDWNTHERYHESRVTESLLNWNKTATIHCRTNKLCKADWNMNHKNHCRTEIRGTGIMQLEKRVSISARYKLDVCLMLRGERLPFIRITGL
jgi:hypothetical protein